MSLSNYLETALMDAVCNSIAYDNNGGMFVKLHTGDPGEDGTANAATETTRKQLTNAASSGGVFTSVNDLVWTSIAGSQTVTHISIWDNSTAGNCLGSGTITLNPYTAGDTVTIATGQLTFSLS
jgi:hypothetical protein